jgi:hypothetical protein
MTKKKNNPAFFLDMPFSEVLERYAGTNKEELDDVLERGRAKKPPGSKRKHKPSGGPIQSKSVVNLRDRRMTKRNG